VRNLEHFPFLFGLDILPEWEAVANQLVEVAGTVMVIGAPDTGKSTLCHYLVYRTFVAGHQVALVDLDLGQSRLGPPAALGLGLFPPQRPGDESVIPEASSFIGQTSPVGAIMEVVVGCRVLVDQAHSRGYTRVVINTSGLVQGPGALRLKRAQAELLQPVLILGLQRERELESLLRGLSGVNLSMSKGFSISPPAPAGGNQEMGSWPILRLPVSSRAVRRGPEGRRLFRESRFRQYLQGSRRLALPWRNLVWEGQPWGHGDPLNFEALESFRQRLGIMPLYGEFQGSTAVLLLPEVPEVNFQENLQKSRKIDQVHWITWPSLHWRLVGLMDGWHRTLALGLILPETWDPESLALWSPLPPPALPRVRFLKVGKLRLNLRGQEINHV
jgi:polynucleotide 5'-kinase involved in rRNA processing